MAAPHDYIIMECWVPPLQHSCSHRLSCMSPSSVLAECVAQEHVFHLGIKNTKLETKFCVCEGGVLEMETTCHHTTVWLLRFAQNWRAQASTQIKSWARLHRGALLFLSNRWHLLQRTVFADVTQTCKYNVCMQVGTGTQLRSAPHTHTHTNLFLKPP